jgi:hypothetical protein
MAFLNDTPSIPMRDALRIYWRRLAFFAAQPVIGAAYALFLPELPAMVLSGATWMLAAVIAMWPAAFKDAPVGYWMLACVAWFTAHTGMSVVKFYLSLPAT